MSYNLYPTFEFETGGSITIWQHLSGVIFSLVIFLLASYFSLRRSKSVVVITSLVYLLLGVGSIINISGGLYEHHSVVGISEKVLLIFSCFIALYFSLLFLSCLLLPSDSASRRLFAQQFGEMSYASAFMRSVGMPIGTLRSVKFRNKLMIILCFTFTSLLFSAAITMTIGFFYGSSEKFRLLHSYCERILIRAGTELSDGNLSECYGLLLSESNTLRSVAFAGIILIGYLAIGRLSRKLFTKSVLNDDALYMDRHVLFLRPFELDEAPLRVSLANILVYPLSYGVRAGRMDDMLAEESSHLAPTICIANPAQNADRYGPVRVGADHADWKERVSTFLAKSARIVVISGNTPGIQWEIEQVCRRENLDRLAICVDPMSRTIPYEHILMMLNGDIIKSITANLVDFESIRTRLFGLVFAERRIYLVFAGARDAETYRTFFRMACRV